MQLRKAIQRAVYALPTEICSAASDFIGDISQIEYVYVGDSTEPVEMDENKLSAIVSDLVASELADWSPNNSLNRKFILPSLIAEADRESVPYAKDFLKGVPSKYRECFKEQLARSAVGFVGLHTTLFFPDFPTMPISEPCFVTATSQFKKLIVGSMVRQLPKS